MAKKNASGVYNPSILHETLVETFLVKGFSRRGFRIASVGILLENPLYGNWKEDYKTPLKNNRGEYRRIATHHKDCPRAGKSVKAPWTASDAGTGIDYCPACAWNFKHDDIAFFPQPDFFWVGIIADRAVIIAGEVVYSNYINSQQVDRYRKVWEIVDYEAAFFGVVFVNQFGSSAFLFDDELFHTLQKPEDVFSGEPYYHEGFVEVMKQDLEERLGLDY